MVFINNAESNRRRKRPSQQHVKWAGQLMEELATASLLKRLPKVEKWAHTFRKLNDLQPAADIEKALKWVIANINGIKRRKKGIPHVTSAEGFVHHFHWIMDLVHKERSTQTSPEADGLTSRVLALGWSPEARAELPRVVTASYNRFKPFLSTLRDLYADMDYKLRKKMKKGDFLGSEVSKVDKIFTVYTHLSLDFLKSWFVMARERITERFNNIDYFEWHPCHPDFRRLGLRWTGSEEFWNRLVSTLENAHEV